MNKFLVTTRPVRRHWSVLVIIILGTVSTSVLPVPPLLTLALLLGGSILGLGLVLALRRPRRPHRPPWALGWQRTPVRRPRSPVTYRCPVRRWRMPRLPRPHRRPRPRSQPRRGATPDPVPPTTLTVATLAGVVQQMLPPDPTASLHTIRVTSRQLHIDLALRDAPGRTIRETIAPTLPQARLRGTTIQIPLPPVMAPATSAPGPSLPLTRRGRTTTWAPLATLGHLVLAGPATYVLAAQLASLLPLVQAGALRLVCDDPEEVLPTLPLTGVRGTADARVQARQIAVQHTWLQQQGTRSPAPPLVLVALQPDATAWVDLQPLLALPPPGVHVLVLLGTTQLPVVRTVCHQVPVLEVGGSGVSPLPDAARPTGLTRPRTGQSVYWQAGQVRGRGHTLCRDETALYQDWLDLRLGGG